MERSQQIIDATEHLLRLGTKSRSERLERMKRHMREDRERCGDYRGETINNHPLSTSASPRLPAATDRTTAQTASASASADGARNRDPHRFGMIVFGREACEDFGK